MISSTSASHSAILPRPGGETSWRRTIAPGRTFRRMVPASPPILRFPKSQARQLKVTHSMPQLLQDPGQPGVGDAHGRPEGERPDAETGQQLLGAGDLVGQPRPGTQHQQGVVTVGVVADVVAPLEDLPDQLRVPLRVLPGDEEGGRQPMPPEKVEQSGVSHRDRGRRRRSALPLCPPPRPG